jgi:uncharacterized cupin superfamily protein
VLSEGAGGAGKAARRDEESLEGEFDFYVGDHVERLGPGSFVNVPSGMVHCFRNPGTASARCLGIVCPDGFDR